MNTIQEAFLAEILMTQNVPMASVLLAIKNL